MGDIPRGIRLMGMGMGMGGMPVKAHIARVGDDGRAFVTILGAAEPIAARCAAAEASVPPRDRIEGAEVLIVFEDGDRQRPIITGFVRDTLWAHAATSTVPPPARQVIEGEEEVLIRCGKGSINMTADGRIVIKGTRLTSRASEANKVRGAVVLIN